MVTRQCSILSRRLNPLLLWVSITDYVPPYLDTSGPTLTVNTTLNFTLTYIISTGSTLMSTLTDLESFPTFRPTTTTAFTFNLTSTYTSSYYASTGNRLSSTSVSDGVTSYVTSPPASRISITTRTTSTSRMSWPSRIPGRTWSHADSSLSTLSGPTSIRVTKPQESTTIPSSSTTAATSYYTATSLFSGPFISTITSVSRWSNTTTPHLTSTLWTTSASIPYMLTTSSSATASPPSTAHSAPAYTYNLPSASYRPPF